MKKMITLLFCVGALISTFAQTTAEESRRIILGKQGGSTTEREKQERSPKDVILGRDDERVFNERGTRSTSGTRAQRINEINREYDAKILSIRNNRTLTAAEKERAIRQLNADRARKIKAVNDRYKKDSRYDDRDEDRKHREHDRKHHDDDDDKKYKSKKENKGNHYGWEKGKGNPHKNGGKPGKKNK